jgi:hypothetical protein
MITLNIAETLLYNIGIQYDMALYGNLQHLGSAQ